MKSKKAFLQFSFAWLFAIEEESSHPEALCQFSPVAHRGQCSFLAAPYTTLVINRGEGQGGKNSRK